MHPRHIILPGLTTTAGADWRSMIAEIAPLGLHEAAFFPTCLRRAERREAYTLLEQTPLRALPHVHLRDTMTPDEVEYLARRWHTEVFNLHATPAALVLIAACPQYRRRIFLENVRTLTPLFHEGLGSCGGVCLDYSHWEDFGRIRGEQTYEGFESVVQEATVGCCHVSALVREGWWHPGRNDHWRYNRHRFEQLREFDYLEEYRQYFPRYLSLELENPLREQLAVKAHLEARLWGGCR